MHRTGPSYGGASDGYAGSDCSWGGSSHPKALTWGRNGQTGWTQDSCRTCAHTSQNGQTSWNQDSWRTCVRGVPLDPPTGWSQVRTTCRRSGATYGQTDWSQERTCASQNGQTGWNQGGRQEVGAQETTVSPTKTMFLVAESFWWDKRPVQVPSAVIAGAVHPFDFSRRPNPSFCLPGRPVFRDFGISGSRAGRAALLHTILRNRLHRHVQHGQHNFGGILRPRSVACGPVFVVLGG